MKRNLILGAFLVTLLVGSMPVSVNAQVVYLEDFEGYFPGPEQRPTFLYWLGGGVDGGVSGNPDPFNPTFPSEISTDGLGEFQQAWKISFDTTNTTSWWWFGGSGGAVYASPEFPAGGIVAGGNDPANWKLSADVRGVGMQTDVATVASLEFYDPDYDTTFGVDGNGDGEVNGATTWRTGGLQLHDNDGNPDGFTTSSVRFDQGSTPTTDVAGDIPRFSNDGNWILGFFGGGGEYQYGANSLTIDNIMIEFIGNQSVLGDYNGDSVVNAADYTMWRNNYGGDASVFATGSRDPLKTGPIDNSDYQYWKNRFGMPSGAGGGGLSGAPIPEPTTLTLVLLGALSALSVRRRQQAC